MLSNARPIPVTSNTDLPTLLDRASKSPVLVERDGEVFRLAREVEIGYDPDSKRVRAMLAATAGGLGRPGHQCACH